MPRPLTFILLLLILILASSARAQSPSTVPAAPLTQNLAGEWRFIMDRTDAGKSDQWFKRDLPDHIRLPGILQAQGFGDDISTSTPWVAALPRDFRWYLLPQFEPYTHPGNIKIPYLSQPPKHYLGVAWYQRDIDIPASWQGKREHVFLERPRWESTLYLDDTKIGSNNSLVAPHDYELGILSTGKHRLSIRLDNRMSVFPGTAPDRPGYRPDGHSVSDALGATWNGIAGRIELSATSPIWIDDLQIFPNVATHKIKVKATIANDTHLPGKGSLGLIINLRGDQRTESANFYPITWDATGGKAEVDFDLGPLAKTWEEFSPNLYDLRPIITIDPEQQLYAGPPITFGLREISAAGKQLLLNGHEINIRATHFGGDFPLTGYPATDIDSWKKIIQTCKDFGLNGIRFHSWCPPEAAFAAADELGFYLQPECGMWNDFSVPNMPQMLESETARMEKAYGNHPSYFLLSPTNEPAGRWNQVLPQWAARWHQTDPRRLYAENTGRVNLADRGPTFAISVLRGNTGWFGRDYSAGLRNANLPVLAHEVGQWCAYPDFDVIKEFTGYLQPGNYEIFRDFAAAHGVLQQNKAFAYASGKFQLACYKEEIEANLRTPGLSGFELLDLHDYLGQGGALVGLLDPFWKPKSYITAAQFRRFCGPTVPLARLRSNLFRTGDRFEVDVEIAHYGSHALEGAVPEWKIIDLTGKTAATGELVRRDIPAGQKNLPLGRITVDLSKLPAPSEYKLVVGLRNAEGELYAGQPQKIENDWNFWLYPNQISTAIPADLLVTSNWPEAQAKLAAAGKVLYIPAAADLGKDSPPLKNLPIFWNRLMNPSAAGDAMLGLLINPNHAALAKFPTENFCDWQWASIINNVRAINLDRAPKDLQPFVQPIDDWARNYKLGLLFECNVGPGKLLVSGIDFRINTAAALQELARSLYDYTAGDAFQPQATLTPAQAAALFPGSNATSPKNP